MYVIILQIQLTKKPLSDTEIDYSTYLQQVHQIWLGERDYSKVSGDSGPLVYPAGFVYTFQQIRWIVGISDPDLMIRYGQILFGAVYLATTAIVMRMYRSCGIRQYWPYVLLILSRRIHSIYILRMFNDTICMFFLYLALLSLINGRYMTGAILYSFSVSIKMNTLLFLPGLILTLYLQCGFKRLVLLSSAMGAVQVILGLPFLIQYPRAYLSCAFDFKRQFLYKWTVNWRFLDESVFLSSVFAKGLLLTQLISLSLWAYYRVGRRLDWSQFPPKSKTKLGGDAVVRIIAESNMIGIICARSLHYQFYSWYFHLIPVMASSKKDGASQRAMVALVLFLAIEWAWNVFPSTSSSSLTLLACNASLLFISLETPL